MPAPRLSAKMWTAAYIRRCQTMAVPAMVVHHGDDTAGVVLLKINTLVDGCAVYQPATDMDGSRYWRVGTGEALVSESDADVAMRATLKAGEVTVDRDERVEVALGDTVLILIESDVAEHAHLHGYDILVDVSPTESGSILFMADTPGKFELEFENSGTFIVELIVS